MSKTIQFLTLALIVQCLILATVVFTKNQDVQQDKDGLLLTFDPTTIDSLIIGDGTGELELKKQGEAWSLPAYDGLPVKAEKVSEVLDELANLHTGWPIASSESAATRFEVTMENAQKSLKLKSGDEIIDKLYLGTSPGFRKVHARTSGDKNIYAVEFSQHRVSTKGEDWFDKELLSYQSEINKLKVGTTEIAKTDAGWSVSGLAQEQTDANKVSTWLKNLASLPVRKLINGNDKDKLLVLDPNLEIQVEGDGSAVAYKLWKKDEQYFIKRSDSERLFEIASYQAQKYFDLDVSSFKTEPPAEASGAQADPFSPEIGSPN